MNSSDKQPRGVLSVSNRRDPNKTPTHRDPPRQLPIQTILHQPITQRTNRESSSDAFNHPLRIAMLRPISKNPTSRIDAYVLDTMHSQLRPTAATASSNPLPSKSKKKSTTSSSARDSLQESATAPQSQPQNQAQISSRDLIHQLRNPETLRMAIIAHEILKRPYQ